uniref:Uncharacterized protein n=2 Tax=Meloidogyne incognita TaxID=6306 RepID=A0A914NS36_MELIC
MNVKLPEIKLPEFSGDTKNWQSFFEEFKAAVDEQPIPDKRKMQYLKSALRNEALEIVEPYPLEAGNYKLVLDLLKNRFGDKITIRSSLHSELRKLPRANQFVPEIRKTLRKIEAIINQLKLMGENTEHQQLVLEVESKMPKKILTEIFKRKRTDPLWSLEKLLKFLDEYLKLEEDVHMLHKDFGSELNERPYQKKENREPEKYKNREPEKYNNREIYKKFKGTAMYAFQKEQKHACKFCSLSHWEDKLSEK